jgi:hypothetical protein
MGGLLAVKGRRTDFVDGACYLSTNQSFLFTVRQMYDVLVASSRDIT